MFSGSSRMRELTVFILGIYRGESPKSLIFPQKLVNCVRLFRLDSLLQVYRCSSEYIRQLAYIVFHCCPQMHVQEPAMTLLTDIILSCNGRLRPKQTHDDS